MKFDSDSKIDDNDNKIMNRRRIHLGEPCRYTTIGIYFR